MNLSAFPVHFECALDVDILYSNTHKQVLEMEVDPYARVLTLHKSKNIIYMLTSDGSIELEVTLCRKIIDGIKYISFEWVMDNQLRLSSEEQVRELIEIQLGNEAFLGGFEPDNVLIRNVA